MKFESNTPGQVPGLPLLHSSADKALDFGAQGGRAPYNGGIIQDHYPLYTAPIIDISIIQHGSRDIIFIQPRDDIDPPLVWVVIEADTTNLSTVHTTCCCCSVPTALFLYLYFKHLKLIWHFFSLVADIFVGISKTKR